jgi:hypothetical protein
VLPGRVPRRVDLRAAATRGSTLDRGCRHRRRGSGKQGTIHPPALRRDLERLHLQHYQAGPPTGLRESSGVIRPTQEGSYPRPFFRQCHAQPRRHRLCKSIAGESRVPCRVSALHPARGFGPTPRSESLASAVHCSCRSQRLPLCSAVVRQRGVPNSVSDPRTVRRCGSPTLDVALMLCTGRSLPLALPAAR